MQNNNQAFMLGGIRNMTSGFCDYFHPEVFLLDFPLFVIWLFASVPAIAMFSCCLSVPFFWMHISGTPWWIFFSNLAHSLGLKGKLVTFWWSEVKGNGHYDLTFVPLLWKQFLWNALKEFLQLWHQNFVLATEGDIRWFSSSVLAQWKMRETCIFL